MVGSEALLFLRRTPYISKATPSLHVRLDCCGVLQPCGHDPMHVLVLVPGCAVVWRGCVMVKCCAGMAWTICSEGEVDDRGVGKATC